jgi:hypothetical protein
MNSESSSGQRSLAVLSAIDQKHSGFDTVFLAKFVQEFLGYCSRWR